MPDQCRSPAAMLVHAVIDYLTARLVFLKKKTYPLAAGHTESMNGTG